MVSAAKRPPLSLRAALLILTEPYILSDMHLEFTSNILNIFSSRKAPKDTVSAGDLERKVVNAPFTYEAVELIVSELDPRLPTLNPGDTFPFAENQTITFTTNSGESYGFTIETKDTAFFLRIAKSGLKQSYKVEEQQLRILEQEFAKKFRDVSLSFPRFMYVAETWCVTEFENGKPLQSLTPELNQLIDSIEQYLERQSNPIFQNIGIDLMPTNFLVKTDGTLCWLDPFYLKK